MYRIATMPAYERLNRRKLDLVVFANQLALGVRREWQQAMRAMRRLVILELIGIFAQRPRMAVMSRAVQRSQLSPGCNSFQDPDAEGVVDDSVGRKSLNLCEATESIGGRLEVAGAVSRAARRNP